MYLGLATEEYQISTQNTALHQQPTSPLQQRASRSKTRLHAMVLLYPPTIQNHNSLEKLVYSYLRAFTDLAMVLHIYIAI